MSQHVSVMPAPKADWSIKCTDAAQYEGIKMLLKAIGYTYPEDDRFVRAFEFIASSDWYEGGVTQSHNEEANHFDNIMDFLIFHFDAGLELEAIIKVKREELALLEAKLAA